MKIYGKDSISREKNNKACLFLFRGSVYLHFVKANIIIC
jgi:hypothetical protein